LVARRNIIYSAAAYVLLLLSVISGRLFKDGSIIVDLIQWAKFNFTTVDDNLASIYDTVYADKRAETHDLYWITVSIF